MTPLTFISGVGAVAMRYGVEEAIFLNTIVYWVRENKSKGENFRDDRWWTYNSIRGLAEIFPWWTEKQIRRIANSCIDQKALVTANYNKDGRDRTVWYSPSEDLLLLYGEAEMVKSICPNGQMQMPNRADGVAQMGEPLPCSNSCNNTPHTPQGGVRGRKRKTVREAPDWKPERFHGFWAFYPAKGRRSKQRAMDAWDKLAPSDELIDTIARALVKLKATEDWQRGIGIPHVSTFLNGARWEDADEVQPENTGDAPLTEKSWGWD